VWRRPPRDLPLVLSCRYTRQVARDNTVRLGPRLVQIPRGPHGRSYAGRRVEVRELLAGRLVVLADARIIARAPSPAPDFTLAPRTHHRRTAGPAPARRPTLAVALAQLAAALPASPGRPHPWRRAYDPALAIKAGYTERWA
jgi:hypothetical protein